MSRFAASTLAATSWVIVHRPADLKAWLDRHAYGEELERETRRLMAKKAELRAKGKYKGPQLER